MTRLFIELYLDEDVDILVAQLIRARGFTVTTTAEAGQLRASDVMQLTFATDQRMTLLTHNRVDFEVLHNAYVATQQQHGGDHRRGAAFALRTDAPLAAHPRPRDSRRDGGPFALHLTRGDTAPVTSKRRRSSGRVRPRTWRELT